MTVPTFSTVPSFATLPEALESSSNLALCLYHGAKYIPENRRPYMLRLADLAQATYIVTSGEKSATPHPQSREQIGSLTQQSFAMYDMRVGSKEPQSQLELAVIPPLDTSEMNDLELRAWINQFLRIRGFMWYKLDDEQLHRLLTIFYKSALSNATSYDLDHPDKEDWAGRDALMYRGGTVVTRCIWKADRRPQDYRQIITGYVSGALSNYDLVLTKV